MAKTFATLTTADWRDLDAIVNFLNEIVAPDADSYPDETALLERSRGLLADLYREWTTEHHDAARELFNAVNLTDKKHAKV